MVAIINNSAADNIVVVKNKDTRSESVDSFSSTIDVHTPFDQPKLDVSVDVDHLESSLGQVVLDDEGSNESLREAISSILVLNSTSCPEVRSLLDSYNGHLVDMGTHLLEGLRDAAPNRLAARVGDYNENLFYEMRNLDQDIGSIIRDCNSNGGDGASCLDPWIQQDIDSFESSIRQSLQRTDLAYRGSFMQTERTMYQPSHYDYDYPILQTYGNRLFLAFFPLTEEGAYLQLWQDPIKKNRRHSDNEVEEDREAVVEGTVVYIPYGKMFVVPSHTLHGGGFKHGSGGNLRFHLYIEVQDNANVDAKGSEIEGASEDKEEEIDLLQHPMNKYTEKHDRRRELCERFVDARSLDCLLGEFFDV